jgi:hypothetical protein
MKRGEIKELVKFVGSIVVGVGMFFVIYWLMWLVIGG